MKTRIYIVFFILSVLLSCKDTQNSSTKLTSEENKEDIQPTDKDNEIEEALYSGYFVRSKNGYDLVLKGNNLYLLKENPTEEERSNHFFLHVLPKDGKLINLDFSPTERSLNDSLSKRFQNVLIFKRKLPEVTVDYDINVGQFIEDRRTWEEYIQVNKLNETNAKYKNEYIQYTKNNQYLKTLESAFNDGYFMKHQSGFDLLLNGHTLYYIKANGIDSDVNDMFFLHVKYEGKEEIHNLDFKGESYQINELLGEKFKNFIIVERKIPDHGKIIEIDTGQFEKNTRSWSVVYVIDKLYDDMNFIYNDQYKSTINSKQ